MNHVQKIKKIISTHISVIEDTVSLSSVVSDVVECIINAVLGGRCVYWYGNGGSAADAQHMAAELVSCFRKERRAIASVALTTDTSIITAIGNDYSFDCIFQRQVEALVKKGDVCIGLSTSGNSQNIYNAHQMAKAQGALTVSFLGNNGGCIKNVSDKAIIIQSSDTPRVQEAHTLLAHIICELVEALCIDSEENMQEALLQS